MSDKADVYYCPICKIPIRAKRCRRCGSKAVPKLIPFERDMSKDSTFLDSVMKKNKNKHISE